MPREYKTVRLSYEAKVWIDDLIIHRNKQLQLALKEDIINTSKLEE